MDALRRLGFVERSRCNGVVRMSKGEIETAVPLAPSLLPIVVRCILLRAHIAEKRFLEVLHPHHLRFTSLEAPPR